MTFTSLKYLIFFPCVFLIYWLIGKKNKNIQNAIVVLASLSFYALWNWKVLGLLLLTSFTTFGSGLLLQKIESDRKRWWVSFIVILFNLGLLIYFKYYNFFVHAFIDAFNLFGISLSISTLKIILPVGISFYTFSNLSYSIDVYQRRLQATSDLLAYMAYSTFFPSILSGPILKASKHLPQFFQKREFNHDFAINACRSILWGAVLKLCLADRLGIYVDAVYGNVGQHNGTTLLLATILYTVQVYADFSGYSLMAIGSANLLGLELPTNFIRPCLARTITDFWRRWHISLSTFYKHYIYFPLGGNRVGKLKWMRNTMIVFFISGLWHGADYTFIIWGLMHGVCMLIEKEIYGDKLKTMNQGLSFVNILRMLLTFSIVALSRVFFRADTLSDSITIIDRIIHNPGRLFVDADTLVFAFAFLILVSTVDFVQEFWPGKIRLMTNNKTIVRWTTYVSLIVLIMVFGVLDGGSFIYFKF